MPKGEVETKFYEYSQNNSGGHFVIEQTLGLGPKVWIEALNPSDADNRAEDIGIYFNGCQEGRDCNCCGDRWYAQGRYWKSDDEGQKAPEVNMNYDFTWHHTIYVHRLDGTIQKITKDKDETGISERTSY